MKNKAIGALGIKYENVPTTLKIAPDAPKDPTAKEVLVRVGITREINEAITAEFKYIIRKFDAPNIPHKVLPNDCNTNILTKI